MTMNRSATRVLGITLVAVLALTIMAPLASFAGSEGRRNTAIALTGASVYFLSKGKTGAGLASAAGAILAWDRYSDFRDDRFFRHRRFRHHRDRHHYYFRDRDRDRDWDRDRHRDWRWDWDRDRNRKHKHHWDRGRHLGWYKHDRDRRW
ncbi:MAG: hypothetical protein Q7T82_17555 [Armatimonadota bacterium]|nr:hypothetical protein [Armatimonadota bacterium]